MGFDVTYHPIGIDEIKEWYIDRLAEVKGGNFSKVDALIKEYEIDEFYAGKYKETLESGAGFDETDIFEKSHGLCIAITQGFFRTYFYIRGGAFTFLIEEYPEYEQYTEKWENLIPDISGEVYSKIIENYSSGVYIPNEKLSQLKDEYHKEGDLYTRLNQVFSENRIDVFMKAVDYCIENGLGLLEATEVVEPNPMNISSTGSFSDLNHCDRDGLVLYADAAIAQIQEIVGASKKGKEDTQTDSALETGKEKEKKSLFKRIFGK